MLTRRNAALKLSILAGIAIFFIAQVPPAFADSSSTQSYTGTLASSDSVFQTTVTVGAGGDVLLQTYGFGGGTNAAGTVIPGGGTDPFLAIFDPTGGILTDGGGDTFGTSVALGNYSSFMGCSPTTAAAPSIGGALQCGDVSMSLDDLAAGTYTIVLSDGLYIANAVFDNGNLSEGFTDEFTGGQFCNLEINGVACPNTTGNYALDVTTVTPTVATPEPASLLLLGMGLLGVFCKRRQLSSRRGI